MKFNTEKHIVFTKLSKMPNDRKRKTDRYCVDNTFEDVYLGKILWHNSWRRYAYVPENDLVFSDRCLIRIGEFVLKLNEEHKALKEMKNNERTMDK